MEALYDLCFAPGREALSSYRLRDGVDPVAGLSLVARDGEGILAAAIRYWPVRLEPLWVSRTAARLATSCEDAAELPPEPTREAPDPATFKVALLLGPVAVHPTHQGEGLGAYLIRESLMRAHALGWPRVMLVGDAPYYSRFGFEKLTDVEMPPPTNPDRVLGYELTEGTWDGVTGRVVRWSAS